MPNKYDAILGEYREEDGGLWEQQTGDYTALTQKTNTPLFFDFGTNNASPYTIGGGITPFANFVQDNGTAALNIVGISSHGSGGLIDLGSLMFFNRGRGTTAAPLALQNGDIIGGQVFGGYGMGDYQLALTGLQAQATDDWDIVPGAMTLSWLINGASVFSTDAVNGLTTGYTPWYFNTYIGINSTPNTDNRLIVNAATAVATAEVLFASSQAARQALVTQGASGQIANIQEWQNDSGTVLASINASGDMSVPDEAYGVGWDASLEVPTKNAVYDKIQTIPVGDVVGPASSTDNAIARYDLATGKLIQDSGLILDDSNYLIWGGDTNLYRSAANTLKTDDDFHVGSQITTDAVNGSTFYTPTSGRLIMGNLFGYAISGVFGTAGDANLQVAYTNSALMTALGYSGAGFMFGAGGASALDTALYRSAATTLRTNGNLVVDGDVTVSDEVYGAGWNGSLEVPTKNAVYDKIETLSSSGLTQPQVMARISIGF